MTEYVVVVDDNFHYGDEDERYEQAQFGTYHDAVVACQRVVDEFLCRSHKTGMTAEELYACYTSFGEDPFIRPAGPDSRFSAWDYARRRCQELCA